MHSRLLQVFAATPVLLAMAAFSYPAPSAPIPAGAPARAAVRVQALRQSPQRLYKVRAGDTLSSIARSEYGSASRWPALWWANRGKVRNPDVLIRGELLRLSDWHPAARWLDRRAMRAIPRPKIITTAAVSTSNAPAAPVGGSTITPSGSSFEQCVISRESGGSTQVMNASGHWGLYQFSYGTWVAYGGSPADFGHAGAAVQEQVFAAAMATPGGANNWRPYDGC